MRHRGEGTTEVTGDAEERGFHGDAREAWQWVHSGTGGEGEKKAGMELKGFATKRQQKDREN